MILKGKSKKEIINDIYSSDKNPLLVLFDLIRLDDVKEVKKFIFDNYMWVQDKYDHILSNTIINGSINTFKYLEKKYPSMRDSLMNFPTIKSDLLKLASVSNIKLLKYLYENGKIDIHHDAENIFIQACKIGRIKVMEYILSLENVNLDIIRYYGISSSISLLQEDSFYFLINNGIYNKESILNSIEMIYENLKLHGWEDDDRNVFKKMLSCLENIKTNFDE